MSRGTFTEGFQCWQHPHVTWKRLAKHQAWATALLLPTHSMLQLWNAPGCIAPTLLAPCRKPRVEAASVGFLFLLVTCLSLNYLQCIETELIVQPSLVTSILYIPIPVSAAQAQTVNFVYVQSQNMLDGRWKLGRNNQRASSSGADQFPDSCSW